MNSVKNQDIKSDAYGFSNVRDSQESSNVWYSPAVLAKFQLAGLPLTPKGIRERARRDGWKRRRVPGRGGRDGMRDEYSPPADVQRQIDEAEKRTAHYRSDVALRAATAMPAESPNPDGAYEAMRRIRDASDTLQRLKTEVDYSYTPEWGALLLELLAGGQITEGGARLIIERLKAGLRGNL